jgi:hypothetical protein
VLTKIKKINEKPRWKIRTWRVAWSIVKRTQNAVASNGMRKAETIVDASKC